MSRRVRVACVCAALLVSTWADAKPPDLPLEEWDQCKEHRPGALPADPGPRAAATSDHLEPVPNSESKSACPREQAADPRAAASLPYALSASILENLIKLERARRCYYRAEGYREIGRFDLASLYYEKAKLLCPGSRFDQLATTKLRAIYAGIFAGAAEEAEEPEQPQARSPMTRVEEQVAELLEECQRAYADGRYREAAGLAKRAQRLDPDCMAAQSLLDKSRQAIQRLEKWNSN